MGNTGSGLTIAYQVRPLGSWPPKTSVAGEWVAEPPKNTARDGGLTSTRRVWPVSIVINVPVDTVVSDAQ